jgi:outer membrane protein assembly factor BamA
MLGDHRLQTALQVGKSIDDFVAQAAYLNLRSRWNWGVVGGQIPWLTGLGSAPNSPPVDGTITRESSLHRQLHRTVSGLVIYPFSNARRVELSTGLQSITFDRKTISSVYSQQNGRLLRRNTTTAQAAAPALLAESGAALVYDTSVFGPTSPILGERYRLAVAPTFGSLSFTSVTADYRRYVMPVRPFTIAMRLMHLGRYGASSSDPRLLPLVFTMRDVVRGYGDTGRVGVPGGALSANRMVVGNVELRFPLRALWNRRTPSTLPVEGLLFADSGRFWLPRAGTDGAIANLHSLGAGVRLNAAGFVFEFDGVRPIGRPERGWTFSVNFRPGF